MGHNLMMLFVIDPDVLPEDGLAAILVVSGKQ